MVKQSDVEKAAGVWRLLDLRARRLPDGEAKDAAITARNNALRTMGKAVDAAEALRKWLVKQPDAAPEPER